MFGKLEIYVEIEQFFLDVSWYFFKYIYFDKFLDIKFML